MAPLPEICVLRCGACGALDPGPRELCAECGSSELHRQAIEGRGRLVSWTVIRRAPTQFKHEAPYTIAVIDLNDGVRLTGRLASARDDLRAGACVVCVGWAGACYLFEEQPSAGFRNA